MRFGIGKWIMSRIMDKNWKNRLVGCVAGGAWVLSPFFALWGKAFVGLHGPFFLLYVAVALSCFALIGNARFFWSRTDLLFGGCCAYAVLSYCFVTPWPLDSAWYVGILGCALWYALVRQGCEPRVLLYFVIAGGVVQCVVGIMQYYFLFPSLHKGFRVAGCFSHPSFFGEYLVLSLLAVVYAGYSLTQRLRFRVLLLLVGGLLVWGIVCSDSRAVWLSLLVGGGFVLGRDFLQKCLRYKKMGLAAIGCLLAVVLVCLYFYRPVSADGRLFVWLVSCFLMKTGGLLGHGAGTFPALYMEAQADYFAAHPDSGWAAVAGNTTHAFNEFVELAVEQGILGLCLWGVFLWSVSRAKGGEMLGMFRGMLAAVLVFSFFTPTREELSLVFCVTILLGINVRDEKEWRCGMSRMARGIGVCVLLGVLVPVVREHALRVRVEKLLVVGTGLSDEGQAVLSAAEGHFEGTSAFMEVRAKDCYYASDYECALGLLLKLKKLKKTPDLYCDMGDCHVHLGQWRKAEECLTKAVLMIPSRVKPLLLLFYFYRDRDEEEKAKEVACRILRQEFPVVNSLVLRARHEARQYLVESNKKGGGI